MEKNRGFRFFGILLVIITMIFSLYFVLAAAPAPTTLKIIQNVTPVYDEGVFTVNWTSGGVGSNSYNIYVHADNVGYLKTTNDSATGYSFSNTTTEANYTFIIEAVNSTGNTNSTTNISMYVDRTAPVITLPQYTNATAKKNTDDLILNISISDVSSGLTGTLCIVDVNGTNQTIVPSGATCNSSSVKLTNLGDGNQIISVWVNDTVNILGLNNSFVVSVDTTAPTVTLTKKSGGATRLELTVSGDGTCTADRSGATISGSTLTETGLSCGQTYAYVVTCTDSAGNAGASSSTSFTTTGCSGDSGGTTTPPPEKTQSWSKITPGAATIMKNFDSEIGIKEIQIEVNNEAQNVRITVTKHPGKPAAVSVEKDGKVYGYIEINTFNLKDELNKATVNFSVEKSWLSNNGLDIEDIVFSRFDETNDVWNELITTYTGSDGNDEIYEVELTEFSFFAIGEKTSAGTTGEGTTGGTGTGDDTTTDGDEQKRSLAWLWVLIAVLVLIGLGWKIKTGRQ